jgi:hypothetical protein
MHHKKLQIFAARTCASNFLGQCGGGHKNSSRGLKQLAFELVALKTEIDSIDGHFLQ